MEIGGSDFIFKHSWEDVQALSEIVKVLRAAWPEMVVEDGDTGQGISSELVETDDLKVFLQLLYPSELMFYENENWRQAWSRDGATEETKGKMIHVLVGSDQGTIVVDDPGEPVAKKVLEVVGAKRA